MSNTLLEFDTKNFEPILREMAKKTQEDVLMTLANLFSGMRDTANVQEKPGLQVTVDLLLGLLQSIRDSK